MIRKPTVLVLGAGASIPYGYPSGAGLVKEIFQNIGSNEWRLIYDAFGIEESEVNSFRAELLQSQKPSIDAFLEHRTEYMKVGKVAIALSLLSKENPDVLLDFDIRDKGIYHFLFNSLTTSWEEFKQNKFTIVTFNYDRSLEHFLFSALKHSYNKSDLDVAEAIQRIPIIHVHGSLGPLPWQASDGIDYYPLFSRGDGPYEFGKRIKVASENIVIVSEAQPQSKEFDFAHKQIKEAERIYFLGFGYYRTNLERLGLKDLEIMDYTLIDSNNIENITDVRFDYEGFRAHTTYKNLEPVSYNVKYYRGSGLGLGAAQMRSIQNEWRIGLVDNKCNALEFLKEYAELS
jgi:hypothetical protein